MVKVRWFSHFIFTFTVYILELVINSNEMREPFEKFDVTVNTV